MTLCEKCGEGSTRRRLCWHCGRYVCGYCWAHYCQCAPGHTPEKCKDLAVFKRFGADYINRLRGRLGLKLLNQDPFEGIVEYYKHPKATIPVDNKTTACDK